MAASNTGVLAPFTMKGFYLLTWGTALGAHAWNSVAGYQSFRALPGQTFGALQSRLQPAYFSFQTLTTSTLLLTHLWFHPDLISSPHVEPHWATSEEGRQGLWIVASAVASTLNLLVFGPLTNRYLAERQRLERIENKQHDDPYASAATQINNKKFSALHGVSTTLNTISWLSLVGLGLAVSY